MPSPHQIARCGHIATRLRALLAERQWRPKDLADQLGLAARNERQMVHMWLGAYSAPNLSQRPALARLCRCSPEDFAPRDLIDGEPPANGTGKALVRVEQTAKETGVGRARTASRPKPGGEAAEPVIAYTVLPGGLATLTVRMTGPEHEIMPYLQLLRVGPKKAA